MVRRVAPAGCMLAALALAAGACGGTSSREVAPGAGGEAGGGGAGDGSGSGRGGEGTGAATGGGLGDGGRSSAGLSGMGAGTGGSAGAAAAGRSGGAAGANEAGAGGSAASQSTAGPDWIPTGVFGPSVDWAIGAIRDYLEAICRSGLCLGPDDDEILQGCIEAEFHNFAPSPEWLACASRSEGAFESYLRDLTQYYGSCAQTNNDQCLVMVCQGSPPSYTFEGCPPWNEYPFTCRNGVDPFIRCNDERDCADGYDELNCEPEAESYTCSDGAGIDWHALCDGTEDCADGIDEFRCEP